MRHDFTYIDDIVTGWWPVSTIPFGRRAVKAGGSHGPHRIYNIGNHRSEELGRMLSLIEKACGRTAKVELMPMQLGDVQDTFADIEAIQNDLGFEPSTTIEDGIPRFVDWYRSYH